MNLDQQVIRAMLRLARQRKSARDDDVTLRVDGPASAVRASMRRLEAAGLVELRSGRAARLTLSGLAVAVALVRSPTSEKRTTNTASQAA